jgi:hypothetical protein
LAEAAGFGHAHAHLFIFLNRVQQSSRPGLSAARKAELEKAKSLLSQPIERDKASAERKAASPGGGGPCGDELSSYQA